MQYANAAAVSELLKDITPSVQIDFSGNNLLVTASPKKINEIEAIVKDIDTPAVQIMLEARLIEVSLKDESEMGIDWEKLASTSIILLKVERQDSWVKTLMVKICGLLLTLECRLK